MRQEDIDRHDFDLSLLLKTPSGLYLNKLGKSTQNRELIKMYIPDEHKYVDVISLTHIHTYIYYYCLRVDLSSKCYEIFTRVDLLIFPLKKYGQNFKIDWVCIYY